MAMDMMPHDSLPPATGPFRLSVRIDPRLLSTVDPAMSPWEETDSITSVRRKGNTAWAAMAQRISQQLFESQTTPMRNMTIYWPKYPQDAEARNSHLVKHCKEFGMIFDSGVDGDDANPRVVALVASKNEAGRVVFDWEEVGKDEQSRVNGMVRAASK